MKLFFAIAVWAADFSATASCSGPECDAVTDETSMLQVHANVRRTGLAELLALQKQVNHLSMIESQQIQLIRGLVDDITSDQLEAVSKLPTILQNLAPMVSFVSYLQHGQRWSQHMEHCDSDIQGDSATPAISVQSFFDKYREGLQEAIAISEEFATEEAQEGILAQWCTGMHNMARHMHDMWQEEGLVAVAEANNHVSELSTAEHVELLQGVDVKHLETEKLSEEQASALKQQLQAAQNGLNTLQEWIRRQSQAFVQMCTDDLGPHNCPSIDYPILSGPLRRTVERCLDVNAQVSALGNMAEGPDIAST